MSYYLHTHRQMTRDGLSKVIRQGGPGWYDYARGEARRLVREDRSVHTDLVQYVDDEIRQDQKARAQCRTA